MSVIAIQRGDVLIAGNGVGLATLVPVDVVPGGFGTSPFGLSFGIGGSQPNAAGVATVTAVTGLATLQTT